MSSPLAIAAVTQVIKNILKDELDNANLPSGIGKVVSTFPPDKIETGNAEDDRLNLYMYMTAQNKGWKNRDFPSHDRSGRRISNPFLPLDLFYILTAYGEQEANSEVLLGQGMLVLHENPVLAREQIRLQLTPAPGGSLPSRLNALSTAGLAEQIEQIKITPDVLSTEEVSRLWTSFGAKYRPSAYYRVSVLLIESRKAARTALPVKKPLIFVRPFKHPIITKISSRSDAASSIVDGQKILPSHQLVIKGEQLKGEVNAVNISGINLSAGDIIEVKDDQIITNIDPNVKAGLQSVQVIHKIKMGEPAADRAAFSSNAAAFVLCPDISNINETTVQVNGGSNQKAIRMTINPFPEDTQEVILLLNELGTQTPQEYRFEKDFNQTITPAAPVGVLTIPIANTISGQYLVRIRVDNAESKVADDYQSPSVNIS